MEILSKSSVGNDRVLKKELYRRSAVPEYWIVDPDDHAVEQYVLRDDAYELVGAQTAVISLQVLDGVRVDLSQVW